MLTDETINKNALEALSDRLIPAYLRMNVHGLSVSEEEALRKNLLLNELNQFFRERRIARHDQLIILKHICKLAHPDISKRHFEGENFTSAQKVFLLLRPCFEEMREEGVPRESSENLHSREQPEASCKPAQKLSELFSTLAGATSEAEKISALKKILGMPESRYFGTPESVEATLLYTTMITNDFAVREQIISEILLIIENALSKKSSCVDLDLANMINERLFIILKFMQTSLPQVSTDDSAIAHRNPNLLAQLLRSERTWSRVFNFLLKLQFPFRDSKINNAMMFALSSLSFEENNTSRIQKLLFSWTTRGGTPTTFFNYQTSEAPATTQTLFWSILLNHLQIQAVDSRKLVSDIISSLSGDRFGLSKLLSNPFIAIFFWEWLQENLAVLEDNELTQRIVGALYMPLIYSEWGLRYELPAALANSTIARNIFMWAQQKIQNASALASLDLQVENNSAMRIVRAAAPHEHRPGLESQVVNGLTCIIKPSEEPFKRTSGLFIAYQNNFGSDAGIFILNSFLILNSNEEANLCMLRLFLPIGNTNMAQLMWNDETCKPLLKEVMLAELSRRVEQAMQAQSSRCEYSARIINGFLALIKNENVIQEIVAPEEALMVSQALLATKPPVDLDRLPQFLDIYYMQKIDQAKTILADYQKPDTDIALLNSKLRELGIFDSREMLLQLCNFLYREMRPAANSEIWSSSTVILPSEVLGFINKCFKIRLNPSFKVRPLDELFMTMLISLETLSAFTLKHELPAGCRAYALKLYSLDESEQLRVADIVKVELSENGTGLLVEDGRNNHTVKPIVTSDGTGVNAFEAIRNMSKMILNRKIISCATPGFIRRRGQNEVYPCNDYKLTTSSGNQITTFKSSDPQDIPQIFAESLNYRIKALCPALPSISQGK